MSDTRLARVHENLETLKKNSIRILSTECDEDQIPVGSSKRGGRPDFPDNLTWPVVCFADPTWTQPTTLTLEQIRNELDDDIAPLAFVAQIRLSEVQALDIKNLLPTQGMLYFFEFGPGEGANFEDIREIRVLFSPSESGLKRTNWPDEIDPDCKRECMSLQFSSEWQLPTIGSHFVDIQTREVSGLEFTIEEFELYQNAEYDRRNTDTTDQLLGYGYFSQENTLKYSYRGSFLPFVNSMNLESQYTTTINDPPEKVLLLFQMDLGVHRRFFFIHTKDLVEQKFERSWSGIE
jgi:uncharacterized protein YwqG